MKTLQNNYTTPEQSHRLLELGLPADSTDMYYCKMHTETFWSLYVIGSGATYTSISTPPYDFMFVPCWSVGRLIEITTICREWFKSQKFHSFVFQKDISPLQITIEKIERAARMNLLDFSKLED